MSSPDAQTIVDANEPVLRTFVLKYLLDNGITIQLVEAVTVALFGKPFESGGTVPSDVATSASELVATAIKDVIELDAWADADEQEFVLQTVIDSAASLEFLVRYARRVNPAVFAPEVIPSDEVVAAALELFHASKRPHPDAIEVSAS
jgi:hypothetical protein